MIPNVNNFLLLKTPNELEVEANVARVKMIESFAQLTHVLNQNKRASNESTDVSN
jgi:hypothetical protein